MVFRFRDYNLKDLRKLKKELFHLERDYYHTVLHVLMIWLGTRERNSLRQLDTD